MELIYPNVELWQLGSDINTHIERCARVCYASENQTNSNFVDNLIARGHKSMLRHASFYYKIPVKLVTPMDRQRFIHSPYCGFRKYKDFYYISTNGQYHLENAEFFNRFSDWKCNESVFKEWNYTAELIRLTFCVDTQASTARELNRVSPNSIAEQSTRYVDFNKKGLKICVPHWYGKLGRFGKFIARCAWRTEAAFYKVARRFLKPQDAREFLPLVIATKAVYTYNALEWRYILDLRFFGKTGKPHPNAKIIASLICNKMIECGYKFDREL